jgi:hypothetical protein
MTRDVQFGTTIGCLRSLRFLTRRPHWCGLAIEPETRAISVAWSQKTVKGLGPPGSPESGDPYSESGQRRARVPKVARVGSCKTLTMGSNPIVASSARVIVKDRMRVSRNQGDPCASSRILYGGMEIRDGQGSWTDHLARATASNTRRHRP